MPTASRRMTVLRTIVVVAVVWLGVSFVAGVIWGVVAAHYKRD